MKTILAAIDFSPTTESVLNLAIQLARHEQARIMVLHVNPTMPGIPYAALTPDALDVMVTAAREKARHELTEIVHRLGLQGIESETRLIVGDRPAATIVETAGKISAAWLVLGAHGHGRVYEAFMGSTALMVVRKAPCPVAIVPAAVVELKGAGVQAATALK